MTQTERPRPTIADAWLHSPAEMAASLGVTPDAGLTEVEAQRRLERWGTNELRGTPVEPAWRRLVRQFTDPLVLLLIVAIAISAAAWVVEGASGLPLDALVIGVILVANAVLGYVQEAKAADAVAALAALTAASSTVMRGGRLATIASSQLVPGDVLILAEGDAVGADARLLNATALRIQEASLTGEATPSQKDPAKVSEDAPLGDRSCMVYRGTAVVAGVGRAVVTATGMDTELGRIATLLEETAADASPLQRQLAGMSKVLGGLVLVLAVIVMAALALVNGVDSLDELVAILLLGVSLAVAAVPEGLPAILTLVLAVGVQNLARRNAVVKDLHSVETLGSASVIASDKTGTLTTNEMTLQEIVTASGRVQLSGTGYDPGGSASVFGDNEAVLTEARRVIVGGALANNAQFRMDEGAWGIVGDPTEAAFLVAQHKLDGVAERVAAYRRAAEIPFSSERRMMSVLGRREGRLRVFTKGAPDVLLEHCTRVQVGADVRPLTAAHRATIADAVAQLTGNSYRTLGVAWRDGDDEPDDFDDAAEEDLVWAGVVGILDPPRPEVTQALSDAHRAGIRTLMITGDHPAMASRIADDIGLVPGEGSARVLTGRELDDLSEQGWRTAARDVSVYARVAPEHKLRIVAALRDLGHIVAVTGDGVNDAPALKAADIGVAMGITGTEVTKGAATMILGDDNYATIVAAVRQGRVILDNIRKFLRYLLSSNTGEVVAIFVGVVAAPFLGLVDPANPTVTVVPLLATQILWINLVTDSGPALAMGVDPEIEDVMSRPPRRLSEPIITAGMWVRIVGIGSLMGLMTIMVFDLCLPGGLFPSLDAGASAEHLLIEARTTAFTALVFTQLFNALASRSERSSFLRGLFTNRWLWASIGVAVVLQIAVVEWLPLQTAFGTTGLDAQHWAVAVGAGAVVLAVDEITKAVLRRRPTQPANV